MSGTRQEPFLAVKADLEVEARRPVIGSKRVSFWLLPNQELPQALVLAAHEEARKESA